jgi:hypothetical protein
MEYLRKTIHSKKLEEIFELPEPLKNRQVEVIILPFEDTAYKKKSKSSLGGVFHKYANPSLIPMEEEAWQNAVEDKHENS